MLNMMRSTSSRALLLNGALSATLLAGSAAALAANVTVDLCATAGVMTTLPGAPSVAVLRYAPGTCPAAVPTLPDVVKPGGPVITVNVDDVVTVNLYNSLPEASGLLFQGQAMVPDTTGVAAVNGTTYASKSYTFTARKPGTYLYEAALLPNAQHQVAMGLHGALVVRPTTALQAYADPATAYNDEAVLVLSEIDPALNNFATLHPGKTPADFDMRNFAPRYFLINGKPYPATDAIASASGNKLLLRYVNAGVKHHSMAVLGLRQNFVAKDASLLPMLSHNVVAETLAPGQTGDAIATLPTGVTTEIKFAVYDAALALHNSNMPGMGGMLTFVTAGTGSAAGGPTASALTLAPSPTNGSVDVALGATFKSSAPANNITAAEYFIDSSGANGSGLAMSGTFGSATVPVTATISVGQLANLATGTHMVYVHGRELVGGTEKWGVLGTIALNLDKLGPTTSSPVLTPNPSSGAVNVALHATGNDTASGGSNVVAAEYFLGVPGTNGTGKPMAVNQAAPIASLDATIAPPVATGLVYVHSKDALGNWGAFTQITLTVVATGPTSSVTSVAKTPNNGVLPLTASQPVVRVTASMAGAGANIAGAEAFIDTVGANGTGLPFVPSDGIWNSAAETGYGDIPLATVKALSNGSHTIYVRAKDALGNWGSSNATTATWPLAATTVLVVDKAVPTITSATLAPSTMSFGYASTALTVVAADAGTGIVGAQYWLDGTTTPPANATAFTGSTVAINTSTLAGGTYSVRVRVQDAASNWSTVTSATLYVVRAVPNTYSTTLSTSEAATNQANNLVQAITVNSNNGVLTNDQPTGVAGRTAGPSAPTVSRISGGGAATMTVNLSANGSFTYTLSVPNTVTGNANIRAAKRGTYQFTYTETLNSVTSSTTVTITVN